MLMKRRKAMALVGGGVLSLATGSAHAQEYPNRQIRLIVPFPAGGASDLIGRITAAELQGVLKQPVIVDNRAGANGIIGVEHFLQQPADGYTLLVSNIASAAVGRS